MNAPRLDDMSPSDKARWISHATNADLRLRFGELTSDEIRLLKAAAKWILG